MDANRSATRSGQVHARRIVRRAVGVVRIAPRCLSLFTATFGMKGHHLTNGNFLKPISYGAVYKWYSLITSVYRPNCIREMRRSNLWSLLKWIKPCFSVVYHQLTTCADDANAALLIGDIPR